VKSIEKIKRLVTVRFKGGWFGLLPFFLAVGLFFLGGFGKAIAEENPDAPDLRMVGTIDIDSFSQSDNIAVITSNYDGGVGNNLLNLLNSGNGILGIAIPWDLSSFIASGGRSKYEVSAVYSPTGGGADLDKNKVSIVGGGSNSAESEDKGKAENNLVWIDGAEIGFSSSGIGEGSYNTEAQGLVIGGASLDFSSMGNKVLIASGKVHGEAVGGGSSAKATTTNGSNPQTTNVVKDNIVEIIGGEVNRAFGGSVYPSSTICDGISEPCGAEVKNNHVYVKGGVIYRTLTGGYSDRGNVTENEVLISGGDFKKSSIYGGESRGKINHESIRVEGNYVQIDGGHAGNNYSGYISEVVGGGIAEGKKGQISGNKVVIYNPINSPDTNTGIDKVYGGILEASSEEGNYAKIDKNQVTVYQDISENYSLIDDIYGGAVIEATSKYKSFGDISNNNVIVWGNVFGDRIIGGYAEGNYGETSIKLNKVLVGGGARYRYMIAGAVNTGENSSKVSGEVNENSVIIQGVKPYENSELIVAGASIEDAEAGDNCVEFRGGQDVINTVYSAAGAIISKNAKAADWNRVEISGGVNTILGNIYGVYNTGLGNVGSYTRIVFNGGETTIEGSVYGVKSDHNSGGNIGGQTTILFDGGKTTIKGDLVLISKTNLSSSVGEGSNISFEKGYNVIEGNVDASSFTVEISDGKNYFGKDNIDSELKAGKLNIYYDDAENLFFSKVTVGKLTIEGGSNDFRGDLTLTTTKSINLTKGVNTFNKIVAPLDSLNIDSSDVNNVNIFNENVTTGDISISGEGRNNQFSKKLTITNGVLRLTAGTNSFAQLNVLNTLSISGGLNIFGDGINDLEVASLTFSSSIPSDKINTFGSPVKITSIFNPEGGNNYFAYPVTYTGSGDITFSGGKFVFNNDFAAASSDLIIDDSEIIFKATGGEKSLSAKALKIGGAKFGIVEINGDDDYNIKLPSSQKVTLTPKGVIKIAGEGDLNIKGEVKDSVFEIQEGSNIIIDASSSGAKHGTINVDNLIFMGNPVIELLGDSSSFETSKGQVLLSSSNDLNSYAANIPQTDKSGKYEISINLGNPYQIIVLSDKDSEGAEEPLAEKEPVAPEKPAEPGKPGVAEPVPSSPPADKSPLDSLIAGNGNYSQAMVLIDSIIKNGEDLSLAERLESYMETIKEIYEQSPGAADIAMKQLIGESVQALNALAYDAAQKSQRVVFGRLDIIRSSESLTPPAAGSEGLFNRLWIGGFGTRADQKDDNGVSGYKYDSRGVALGYDRHVESVPGLIMGLSGSFSSGKLESKDSVSSVDVNTAGFGFYLSYTTPNSLFLDSSVAYALSQNEFSSSVMGGEKSGDFDLKTLQFGVRLGGNFTLGDLLVIPSVGFRYVSFTQEEWTVKVSDSRIPANVFYRLSDRIIEIPADVRFQREFQYASATITPELRLGVTLVARKPDNSLNVGFQGYNGSFKVYGIKPKSNFFQGGLGLRIDTLGKVNFFLNYDVNAASKFLDQRISAGLGVDF
jgi:outer membrane autotransporter protein